MSRFVLIVALVVGGWILICSPLIADPLIAAQPPVDVVLDNGTAPPTDATRHVTVAIHSEKVGNLFLPGEPLLLTAFIANSGRAQSANMTTVITAEFGCVVFTQKKLIDLPATTVLEVPLVFETNAHLPCGSYHAEVAVEAPDGLAYGQTQAGIWPGPSETQSDVFGVSYNGALDTAATFKDLDIFKMAGIGWLRFHLQGWIPRGQISPAEAEQYNTFIVEANKRQFHLVAAFTPQISVDPSVDAIRADKDYRESIMAAGVRFGFKVKWWELLRVKPDTTLSPELKGIGFPQLMSGRDALRTADKSLKVLYSLEDPFKWNAMELFHYNLPVAGDAVAMRYNFIGIPEVKANPEPPTFTLDDVATAALTSIRRRPPIWVTEYGFEPSKAGHLPGAQYQAALLARAVILDRALGVERTFWRHTPGSQYDLPLTNTDNSAMPSLLALRTTLAVVHATSTVTELTSPIDVKAFLIQEGDAKRKRGKRGGHYTMVVWAERDPIGLAIKTKASRVMVTDLWGNAIELKPTSSVVLFQTDEFPRFIDLEDSGDVELFAPFARFNPGRMVLHDSEANKLSLTVFNDQRLFSGNIACVLNFRQWPEGKVESQRIDLDPVGHVVVDRLLSVPLNARKGHLYDVNLEILLGTRRIGYLSLPIWYNPGEKPAEE